MVLPRPVSDYIAKKYADLYQADPEKVAAMTDEQVERAMYGHAHWDDRPEGWTDKHLLLWSRGYLCGRAIQALNDAETLYMLPLLLRQHP